MTTQQWRVGRVHEGLLSLHRRNSLGSTRVRGILPWDMFVLKLFLIYKHLVTCIGVPHDLRLTKDSQITIVGCKRPSTHVHSSYTLAEGHTALHHTCVYVPVTPACLLATTASPVLAVEGSPSGVGICPGPIHGVGGGGDGS